MQLACKGHDVQAINDAQGPILAFIYAVKEMLEEGQATLTALPVNVAFVFEGEEENGEFPILACNQ